MSCSDTFTFHTLNLPNHPEAPNAQSLSSTFTLPTAASTDLWRAGPKPTQDRKNAPAIYTALATTSSFRRAAVTVHYSNFASSYDQGGLYLNFPSSDPTRSPPRWIKAGVEYTHGGPHLSVVGADHYSDWALWPINDEDGKTTGRMRLEAVREGGDALWIYAVHDDGRRQALREIKWAFAEDLQPSDAEMHVGVCAARPTPVKGDEGQELVVTFEGLEVETQ